MTRMPVFMRDSLSFGNPNLLLANTISDFHSDHKELRHALVKPFGNALVVKVTMQSSALEFNNQKLTNLIKEKGSFSCLH